MRYKFIFLFITLLGWLALPARADSTGAQQVAPGIKPANATIPQRGTLFRVQYQNHTCYLFGTVHIGQADFYPLEPQVMQAFASADRFTLEVDMRDTASLQSAARKYGVYAAADGLDKHLSPAALAQLKAYISHAGISFDSIVRMKPWMAANFLLLTMLEGQGYHSDLGTETYLLNAAVSQHKAIAEMETADSQLSLFAALTEKQQEQYLIDNLDELQSGEAIRKARELVNAWGSSDQKALDGLLREAQQDKTMSGKFFIKVLLNQRNPEMAAKVATLLKQDQVSFVGVGLLHLLGNNGVPSLLARRGYQVTRLY